MTESQEQFEAYYGFIQDFVSDYDKKPTVFEVWQYQQQRIDILLKAAKVAIDNLRELAGDCGCNDDDAKRLEAVIEQIETTS